MRLTLLTILLITFYFTGSCGDSLKSLLEKEEEEVVAAPAKLSGNISSRSGLSSELDSWQLVLMEKQTNRSLIAAVDRSGEFEFVGVKPGLTWTLVLLSPDLQISSLLSIPSTTEAQVHQYFSFTEPRLPNLTFLGPTISFQNLTELAIDPTPTSDSDGNQIPDAVDQLWSLTGLSLQNAPDSDSDGMPQTIDSDDDNDGILDVFDSDSDNDGIPDNRTNTHDQYYVETIDLATVNMERKFSSSTDSSYFLNINVRLKPTASITGMSIIAPPKLQENAKIVSLETPDQGGESWAGQIYDDGNHFDARENDLLYAVRLELDANHLPRSNQLIFFKVTTLEEEQEWTMSNPYLLSDTTLGTIGATVVGSNISLNTSPFPEGVEYEWSVTVYSSENKLLFSSPTLSTATTSYAVPEKVVTGQTSYKVQISAQSTARVSSSPSSVITGPFIEITP